MRLEFTYRIEDVREAVQSALSQGRRPGKTARGLLGWLVFVVVAAVMFVYVQTPSRTGHAAQDSPELDLMLVLIPAALPGAVLVVLFSWLILKQLRQRPADAREPNARAPAPAPATQGARFVGLLIGGLVVLAVFWLIAPGPQVPVRASRSTMIWVAMSVLLAEIVILATYTQLSTRMAVRSQWNSKPSWRRDKVMIMDEIGLTTIDSRSRIEHRWEYFSKARETRHLFVFHGEDSLMYLLPKRAIIEEELNSARALIQNGIPDSQFLSKPVGFAVLPKLPVPVQPIGP